MRHAFLLQATGAYFQQLFLRFIEGNAQDPVNLQMGINSGLRAKASDKLWIKL